ncbi:metal dependent phosphohydrolase [Desulfofarcimen acetoxidans DSM 771]|uniref:Metal dependent phosphohydrolase n=1 Tax=Desulfofarcimen acetoxidans (strain ATCC 49208 / DSM 771 / KCTC 5769 / VKM B-1644 / 5575) TaxID=485916 RepID=C8W0M4_DESAS|nr:HD domain-containing phosphohydrolase [Desulfofarcimen acetoxidans]ACV63279.1 metal dependent phosphohydrolase [Desulfofarcimen acetoxidans DSM 771]
MNILQWAREQMCLMPYLLEHSEEVMNLSIAVSSRVGLDSNTVNTIGTAAFLHDLGKLTWPKELFHKYPLNALEWTITHDHPIQSVNMLERSFLVPFRVKRLILEHHERPGGRGYPNKIMEPGLETLIIAACDVYSAMVSKREYRPVKTFEPLVALAEVSRFAPEKVVNALKKVVGVMDRKICNLY